MLGRKRPAESQNAEEYIQYVKGMIERCIQRYMCRREAEQCLETHYQIQPDVTRIIWKRLEEENQDFFRWYRIRYLLRKQIIQFNSLLERQVAMMQQMRATQDELPQPDLNIATNSNIQITIPAPQAPEVPLQPDLFVAPAPCMPNLQPEFLLQPHSKVATCENLPMMVSVPCVRNPQHELPLQPYLNAAPPGNLPAMVPIPHVPNLQPEVFLQPDSNTAMCNYPSVPELLDQHVQLIRPADQQLATVLQSGFCPSEPQPRNAARAVVQNASTSVFRSNVDAESE